MSIKNSLYYTDKIHLYQECGNDKSIYLQIHNSSLQVKLELSLQDFLKMIKNIDLQSLQKQAKITDEQIEKHCTKQVEERMNCDGSLKQIFGFMIYGNAGLDKNQQIHNGVNHYKNLRSKIQELSNALNNPSNNLYFGLESILDD